MLVNVLRGLPGSGKSTLARIIAGDTDDPCLICSTDEFFTVGGVYRFDAGHLVFAHNWNFRRFCLGVDGKVPCIIVDNTNSRIWEFKRYVDYAHQRGYEIRILEPNTPWAWDVDECVKRNTHGVPRHVIEDQKKRYETSTLEEVLNYVV